MKRKTSLSIEEWRAAGQIVKEIVRLAGNLTMLLNGRVPAPVIDLTLKLRACGGPISKLKSRLEDELIRQHPEQEMTSKFFYGEDLP